MSALNKLGLLKRWAHKMKRFILCSVAISFASPSYGSVHIRELKSGDYSVTKYNDNNPKIVLTSLDLRKTVKLPVTKTVKDTSKKSITSEGEDLMSSYWEKMRAWMQAPRDIQPGDPFPDIKTNGRFYCGVSGKCFGPEGEAGRPIKPKMREGVHFVYATRDETVYVSKPNPNFGRITGSRTEFSDRARNPGGLPLIGTTERMTSAEFREYWRYITK